LYHAELYFGKTWHMRTSFQSELLENPIKKHKSRIAQTETCLEHQQDRSIPTFHDRRKSLYAKLDKGRTQSTGMYLDFLKNN
jgi:hypothetical protein